MRSLLLPFIPLLIKLPIFFIYMVMVLGMETTVTPKTRVAVVSTTPDRCGSHLISTADGLYAVDVATVETSQCRLPSGRPLF
jgi:hypothetical protein